jgi:D-glycero-D-manno-heptose 1,7-bisphosphate phosphatase
MAIPAVFMDRDGVVIVDVDNLTRPDQVALLPGAAVVIRGLRQAGFLAVVVTNQPVVARGWVTEQQVDEVHAHVQALLRPAGGELTALYFCPHHPSATLPQYRQACDCRKPRPGLLLRAAADLDIDLKRSYMIGDRITDILAGRAAGCTTILVESGRHQAAPVGAISNRPYLAPIETADPIDPAVREDYRCRDLPAAAAWIMGRDR